MQASYTQFLSEQFGVTMGKLNLFDFTPTEFYGDYRTQFMNTGLNLSLAYAMVPMSAYGGGVVILPTKDITLMALAWMLAAHRRKTTSARPLMTG